MTEQAQENIFDMLNKQDEDTIRAYVDLFTGEPEKKFEFFKSAKPEQVGMYFAAYAKYICPKMPYNVAGDALDTVISHGLDALFMAAKEDAPETVLWVLESSLYNFITQRTIGYTLDVVTAMEEKKDSVILTQ